MAEPINPQESTHTNPSGLVRLCPRHAAGVGPLSVLRRPPAGGFPSSRSSLTALVSSWYSETWEKVGCVWIVGHGPSRPSSPSMVQWNTHPPRPPGDRWASAYRMSTSRYQAPCSVDLVSRDLHILRGTPTSTLVLSSGPHHDRQIRRPERVTTSSFTYRFLFLFGALSFLELTIPSLHSYS